jgi:glycosyltransferase involved in cell wall biosynthesis
MRFSIVINNYNYASYLSDAVDSALSQLHEGDEIVVVDDGSTDESPAILKRYAIERGITLIEQENQGQLASVSAGIDASKGEIVVLLDSDDYFLDGYLDRLRQIYADHPEVSFVFTCAYVDGDDTSGVRHTRKRLDNKAIAPGLVGSTKWSTLLFNEFVGAPTSGNSLRRTLAQQSITLLSIENDSQTTSALSSQLLANTNYLLHRSIYSADGVLVRCASLFDAIKYHNDRPGFMYRIHGANFYASRSWLERWQKRRRRKKKFTRLTRHYRKLTGSPTAEELRQEILGRSWAKCPVHQIYIRGRYCMAILCCRGNLTQKLSALSAAIGVQARIP